MRNNTLRVICAWLNIIVFRYMAIGYLIGLFIPFRVWDSMVWQLWSYRGRLYLVTGDVEHLDGETGWFDDEDEDGSYDVFSAIISPIPVTWLWVLGESKGLPVLTTIKSEKGAWVDRREIRRTLSTLRKTTN
jgi:hypothetical protein